MAYGAIDHAGDQALARPYLDRFEAAKAHRTEAEGLWERTGQFLNTSSAIAHDRDKGELRAKLRLDMTMQLANKRLAAMLVGLLFSPWSRFIEGYLRFKEPSHEEAIYLERMSDQGHERLTMQGSSWNVAIYEALGDMCGYGNGCLWGEESPSRGLVVQSQNIMDIWIDQNEFDELDTVFRKRKLRADRAAKLYQTPKLVDLAERHPDHMVELVQCVMPRSDGLPGKPGAQKPFKSVIIDLTHGQALVEGGYDEFPCVYLRFQRRAGALYGTGPGIDATPMQYVRNALMDATLRNAELNNDPPIMAPSNFIRGFDRRVLGLTTYDESFLWKTSGRPQGAIFQLPVGGNTSVGMQMLQQLEAAIMAHYYADWMQPGEVDRMSATEVLDRRDTRLRMLGPLTAQVGRDIQPFAERHFSVLARQGKLEDAPASMDGDDIAWRLVSPLQRIQQGQAVEEMLRGLNSIAAVGQQAASVDPVLRADEYAREIAIMAGTPKAFIRSADEIAQRRNDAAQADAAEQQAKIASLAAPAVAAGAQMQTALER
ncbi:MAG: portal protein [Pseudomonadota bacterium]